MLHQMAVIIIRNEIPKNKLKETKNIIGRKEKICK